MYNLLPGVYQIVYYKENERYGLIKLHDSFTLPPILYGNIERNAIRVWNTFCKGETSTGILLTGQSGSGKSLLAEVICNLAVSKGVPVIYLTAIEVKPELLTLLTSLSDVVVYMDEFGKCTNSNMQDKMLSFFADTTAKRLYIVTENDKWSINRFILNRPGRIRYHIEYKKVPKDMIIDYLNRNVSDAKFKEELYRLYASSSVFSFDHLQALCTEHDRYPDDDIESLVKILNLGILDKPYVIKVEKVIDVSTNEEIPLEKVKYNTNLDFEDYFESFRGFSVSVNIPKERLGTKGSSFIPDDNGDIVWWFHDIKAANCTYLDDKFIYEDKNDKFVKIYIVKWKHDMLSGTEDILIPLD